MASSGLFQLDDDDDDHYLTKSDQRYFQTDCFRFDSFETEL